MLQFILGRALSGKSEYFYNKVASSKNENSIFIVPEQYTFETERNLLKKGTNNVSVLSFTSLIDILETTFGGTSGDKLDDYSKTIIMMRVLKQLKGSLCIFKKYVNSIEFAEKLVALLDEFKASAISLNELESITHQIKLNSTKLKIKELLDIFISYEAIIGTEYIDPADDLNRAYKISKQKEFFKNKNVYIDGFTEFSNAQLKIISCILKDADNVFMSFTCDPYDFTKRKIYLFFNIYFLIDKISKLAKDNFCAIKEPILLTNTYYKNEDLKFLENNLFDFKSTFEEAENIHILTSETPYKMIDEVFLLIHRLIRTKGYKYSDFAVISRDIKKYERYIMSISEKYNISVFLDKRKSLKYSPISRLIVNVLKASENYNSDNILDYLKCGLNIIDNDEIAKLEEYVRLWGINNHQWITDFSMNPNGLEPYRNEDEKEKAIYYLKELNNIRKKVISPIEKLSCELKSSSNYCKAIYNFIKNIDLSNLLNEYVLELEKLNCFKDSDYIRQSYDAFIDVLNSLYKCLGKDNFQISVFIEIFQHSINKKTVGSIPQMIDEVICGSADRIRPARPKIVFLIGVNQYEFPAGYYENSLLMLNDRIALNDCGIEIRNDVEKIITKENYLFYTSASCANEMLFFCSCTESGNKTPSQITNNIANAYKNLKFINFDDPISRIETINNSFSVLAEMKSKKSPQLNDVLEVYKTSNYSDILQQLDSSLEINNTNLNTENIEKLFKKDIYMSASKVDKFYQCRFSYFLNYILKLKSTKPAEIDVINRGTIVHYVLERILPIFKEKNFIFQDNEVENLVDKFMSDYLYSFDTKILFEDNKFLYIFNKIKKLIIRTAYRLIDEFANTTTFRPEFFEFSIGQDIPPLTIKGENNIVINGSIDRVDIDCINGQKYVRIIDYKSGELKFNLNKVLYGLNLQMLIYLYAFVKNNINTIPAGVFYLPVNGGYSATNNSMKMNGILVDDSDIRLSMDLQNDNKYIPTLPRDKYRKDNPLINIDDFNTIFNFLELKIKEMEDTLLKGDISISPVNLGNGTSCKYCDYKNICKIENDSKVVKINNNPNSKEALDIMKEKINELQTN